MSESSMATLWITINEIESSLIMKKIFMNTAIYIFIMFYDSKNIFLAKEGDTFSFFLKSLLK